MSKEYQFFLDKYSKDGWFMFSRQITRSEWGNIEAAKSYLKKYWLSEAEYEDKWKNIQNSIFINQDKGLPELVFSDLYKLIPLRGGCLFTEYDFSKLRACIQHTGDKNFVVVENTFGGKLDEPAFRMRFPIDINWQGLISGNFISSILTEMPNKEYFVFGDSGNWGKYSANEYKHPLDIVGYKEEYEHIFKAGLWEPKDEKSEIFEWLPEIYKSESIKW